MRFFDTHAHLDDKAFDSDRQEVLTRIAGEGVALILDPGCDLESSRKAAALADSHAGVFFAAGFHPEELSKFSEEDFAQLRELARHPKCRAIGEIGLDYYWDDSRKEEQKSLFRQQLELASELGLPVIIHDREAHGDCLAIVREYPGLRGVFHCYSGSVEMAKELLERGWYLGFDGPVTYKNARKTVEVANLCPVDRMLLETDSPYLSPVPMRGKRNDPGNLRFICLRLAEIKGIPEEELAERVFHNGCRLFGIDPECSCFCD